jgi:hypothetical protein
MRYLVLSLFWLLGTAVTAFVAPPDSMEAQKLTQIANEFRSHLGISANVQVAIIPTNPRLASARPLAAQSRTYLLEFDRAFLTSLTDEDKRAIIAHEMGHVWIFTHHPYLQTEPLANEKAELLVPQRSLAKVYERVWVLDGKPGSLAEYVDHRLAPPASEGLSDDSTSALLSEPHAGEPH